MPSGWNNSSLLTAHFSLKKIFLRHKISEKEENKGMKAIKKFKNFVLRAVCTIVDCFEVRLRLGKIQNYLIIRSVCTNFAVYLNNNGYVMT